MARAQSIKFSESSIPPLLFLITISVYGVLITDMGLFWDDWPLLWNAHTYGSSGLIEVFRTSRPFLLPIILLLTRIMPETPLAWQICGLAARFLASLAAWWCLKQIWPKFSIQTLTVSLLFAVYPGFTQQWIPITYVSQLFIPLSAYLLSLGWTARAIRRPKQCGASTCWALLCAALGLFPTEYFIGFEIIRLAIIRNVQKDADHSTSTLKIWLPYSLLWAANLGWLAYFYTSGTYRYYEPKAMTIFGAGLQDSVIRLLGETANAVFLSGFLSWFHALPRLAARLDLVSPFGVLTAGCFAALWFYFGRLNPSGQEQNRLPWSRQAIWIGLAWIIAGRIPSWAAGLPLRLNFSWDRFLLPMMLGACLMTAGLLELLKNRQTRMALTCLLVSLAAGQQLIHADSFRADWERQKEILWQIVWRMPAIRPNTALLTQELPLAYETDLSLTAPLNWLYAPELRSREIPYVMLSTSLRLGGPKLPALEPGLPLEIRYSAGAFRGFTSNMIVFVVPATGCLKVLGPDAGHDQALFGMSSELKEAAALSDLSRIIPTPQPASQPAIQFLPDLPRSWCYYFEKAELARQTGDWAAVTRAGREALNQGLGPRDPAEWLIFIEGYAQTGSMSSAAELSQNVWKEAPHTKSALCALWERLSDEEIYAQAAKKVRQEIGCR